jgi:hypothetical protein
MAASDVRAGGAYVEVFTKDINLVRGLHAISGKMRAFASGVAAIGTSIAGMGTKMLGWGVAMLAPLAAGVKTFLGLGDSLSKMSDRTGISVEALSELTHAAKLSGADTESLEMGIRKMQKTLVDAATGTKESQEAIQRLGLSIDQLMALSPDEQFSAIAEALSRVQDPTQRAAMAMEVFGKSGTKLLPMIAGGAKGIEDLRKRARDLGYTMSGEDAAGAVVLLDLFTDLWGQVKVLAFQVGAALAPALTTFVTQATGVGKSMIDWIKAHRAAVTGFAMLAGSVLAGGAALTVFGKSIGLVAGVLTRVSGAIRLLGSGLGLAGSVLMAVLSPIGAVASALGLWAIPIGLVGAAAAGLAVYFWKNADAARAAGRWIVSAWQAVASAVGSAVSKISDLGAGLWDAIAVGFASAAALIGGLFRDAAGAIGDAISDIGGETGSRLVGTVQAATGSIATSIRDTLGSAWEGTKSAAGGVMDWIGGVFGSALDSIRNTFSTVFSSIWDGVSSFFGDCAAGFENVMSDGQQAFSVIAQALAQGDLSAAFGVVVALLKLEWARLTGWMTGKWISFKGAWTETVIGFQLIWNDVVAQMKSIWADLIGFLTKLWNDWSNSIAVEWTSKIIAPVIAKIQGVSVESVQRNLTEDFARNRAAAPSQTAAIDAETARRKAEIEADRKKYAEGKGSEASAAAAAQAQEEAANQAAVDAAQRNYQDTLRETTERLAPPPWTDLDEADFLEWLFTEGADQAAGAGGGGKIDPEAVQDAKTSVSGTFNPFAAFGMGGGSAMERTAKACEQTAKNTDEIRRKPEPKFH